MNHRPRTRLSSTKISNLPQTIIENILCLVPIKDSVRTSILSREWRYSWTKMPKLVFNEDTFAVSTVDNKVSVMERNFNYLSARKGMNKKRKFFYAVYQVLLAHKGPILEFTLDIEADSSCVEIDHIIALLSRKNTLKKLKLKLNSEYRLPLSVFSLHELTDLYLQGCDLNLEPVSNGFGSLSTLRLELVDIHKEKLLPFLSNCPLLKSLTLRAGTANVFVANYGDDDDTSTLFDLFKCVPMIEELTFSLWELACFGLGTDRRELPTSLVHLKYIWLEDMFFDLIEELRFVALLMRSSPNLEIIKLRNAMYSPAYKEYEIYKAAEHYYSDISLENLKEIEIEIIGYPKPILEFVTLMMTKSPALKKVRIITKKDSDDKILKMCKDLQRFSSTSPLVEIIVERFSD